MEISPQLKDVADAMKGFQKTWFVCGGWAIDLFLDKQTREHTDVDVGIFRQDQEFFREYLNDWQISKIIESEAVKWGKDELLELPTHELKAVKGDKEIEILLNENDDTDWIYRREPTIRYPKKDFIHYRDQIPYLAPEILLLFKSKNTQPKDKQDFESVIDHFSLSSKRWLKNALQKTAPEHEWLTRL